MAILIGADPELFAFDKAAGNYISVHNLMSGTKKNPVPVKEGAIQVDGTAAEFNIAASPTMESFCSRIKVVKEQMESIIRTKNPNVVLVGQPWVEYPEQYWKTIPEEFKELGCDPDYNAYTGEANPRPDPEKLGRPSLRTGSGHVHIGWLNNKPGYGPDVHFEDCKKLVQALDKFLLPVIEKHFDNDTVRRNLYGQPGAFRPKPYGVEYRVLSNKWVTDEEATKVVYVLTKLVTSFLWSYKYNLNQYDADMLRHYSGYFCTPSEMVYVRKYLGAK